MVGVSPSVVALKPAPVSVAPATASAVISWPPVPDRP
jgi:hypothetical protein